MADIELVIKIPEEIYESCKRECEENKPLIIDTFTFAIGNGTPLPKGHGRLVTEPTEDDIAKTIGGSNGFADCIRDSVKAVFYNAPTIIAAERSDTE